MKASEKQYADWFRSYQSVINQKPILSRMIIERLDSVRDGFVFTDIGGGSGAISLEIIKKFADKNIVINFIEPSIHLLNDFRNNVNTLLKTGSHITINYINSSIEDAEIPESDFILFAHVLMYLKNPFAELLRVLRSLSPTGTCLVVETNAQSADVLIRKKLGLPFLFKGRELFTNNLLETATNSKFDAVNEKIKSNIDFSDSYKKTDIGKNIISFFYHRSFDELSGEEINNFFDAVKQVGNGQLIVSKIEDYIWIKK